MKRKEKGEAKKRRRRKSHEIARFQVRTAIVPSVLFECLLLKTWKNSKARMRVSLRRDDLEKWTETVIFIRFVPRSIPPPNGSYAHGKLNARFGQWQLLLSARYIFFFFFPIILHDFFILILFFSLFFPFFSFLCFFRIFLFFSFTLNSSSISIRC